jgi:NAD(P)-dependent dehydrogenase (short-subunit alcohol dehydrogenase family)
VEIDGVGAIVFGGAHGVGALIARALADQGADVSIFDLDGRRAAEIAAEFGGYSQHCDVRDDTVVAACITSAMSRFGRAARIVVNAVHVDIDAPIINPEGKVFIPVFNHAMAVNVMGLNTILSYALQAMQVLPPDDQGNRGLILSLIPNGFGVDNATPSASGWCTDAAVRALIQATDCTMSPIHIRCDVVEIDRDHPNQALESVLKRIKTAQ